MTSVGVKNVKNSGRMRGSKDAWPIIWDRLLSGNGGTVLDVGAGEHIWSAPDWEVTRCDNYEQYVGQKREIPESVINVDLNVEPWPFEDNQFDGIIAADVIEHLENIWLFFREATRVAKDFVIITTPNTMSKVSKALFQLHGTFWGFTPSAIRQSNHINPIFPWQICLAAERAHWTVDKWEYINTPFYKLKEYPDVMPVINEQPGRRGVIVRLASPKAKLD
jgi:ubiquinone/menaquinone biosynthesis C-methylase UbiE